MNDLEYLHQISQANRPVAKEKGIKAFLKSKIFKIILAGVVALIFIAIIGSMLGQFSNKERDALLRVNLRMTNMSSTISKYNSLVKSSRLRAMGVSLAGTMSETSRKIYDILLADYDYNEESGAGEIATEEAARAAETDASLERAKMNGILDRTYLHQLIYDVSLLLSLESEAMERTGNEQVKQILQESTNNLNILYEQISNYSDSTN